MNSTSSSVNLLIKKLSSGYLLDKKTNWHELIKLISDANSDTTKSELELKRILTHMSRINLIKREKLSDGKICLLLTTKGRKRLKSIALNEIQIETPESWDKKWRIITFDIPKSKNSKRYELLRELNRMGFKKLLQSMWVHPYPCEAQLKRLVLALGLQESSVYLEANLDQDTSLSLIEEYSDDIKRKIKTSHA